MPSHALRTTTDAPDPKSAARAAKTQARAAKRAERARRKASDDPRDMGRIRQIRRAYTLTLEHDRKLPWLILLATLGPFVGLLLIGFAIDHPIYLALVGLMTALLGGMIMLAQRAKRAAYVRHAGQAGSAEVALQMLPKQWVSTPVIAANRQRDAVHRTVGPGGLVLIGEGEAGRVRQLLASEVRKHERVASGIAVTTIVMGEREGQVPLSRLADHIKKLPKKLQPNQVTDIRARLRALDAVRPQVPLPKGPMPTNQRQVKGARQAMRGR